MRCEGENVKVRILFLLKNNLIGPPTYVQCCTYSDVKHVSNFGVRSQLQAIHIPLKYRCPIYRGDWNQPYIP